MNISIERKEQIVDITIKAFVIAVLTILYSYGGLEGTSKAWRRFVAPTVALGTMFYFTRDWRVLVAIPFMYISLGYGSEVLGWKLFKRAYVGLFYAIIISGYYIYRAIRFKEKRHWIVLAGYIPCVLIQWMIYGAFNPFNSARIEESVLGGSIYGVPVMASKKG